MAIGAAATWSFLMLTSDDFRQANIDLAEYVSDAVTDAAKAIYENTVGKLLSSSNDDSDSISDTKVEPTTADPPNPCGNFKEVPKKDLKKIWNTKDIHGPKKAALKDYSDELKKKGWNNPDIWVDDCGNIAFRDRQSKEIMGTDTPLESYSD